MTCPLSGRADVPVQMDARQGYRLLPPADRVSHTAGGTRPARQDPVRQDGPGPRSPATANSGYGRADDLPGQGYSWSDSEPGQSPMGYQQQSGYGAEGGPAWPDDAGYGWAESQAADAWPGFGGLDRAASAQPRSNAVRGFPPTPGEPLPVYPPGPFAAWNRNPSDRGDREGGTRTAPYSESSGQLATATITPDEFDTDYSLPAIKDPVPGKAGRDAAGRDAAGRAAAGRAGGPGGRRPPAGTSQEQPRGPRSGGRGKARAARTRRRRLSAWLAIGTAGVIIAAVALILVQTSPGGSSTVSQNPTSTPGPAKSSPTPPPGTWEYIGSRKTDPVPLSLTELFPATITNEGTAYTRAKQAKGQNCHAALIGSALQTAVRRAGCTQALRATYFSKAAKVMATIGVFNLKSFALATEAGAKPGHRHRRGDRQGALPRPGLGRSDKPERAAPHQGRPPAIHRVHEPADQPHGEREPEHPHGEGQAGPARLTPARLTPASRRP